MQDKYKVFLCTPHKLGELNYQLIEKIENIGFNVLCAVTHSPQNAPYKKMFNTNVKLIKQSDIFVAVLKDYGKDLTAEVGMAFAWDMPRLGIDYNARKEDVMCYFSLPQIIKPNKLEQSLLELENKLSSKARILNNSSHYPKQN